MSLEQILVDRLVFEARGRGEAETKSSAYGIVRDELEHVKKELARLREEKRIYEPLIQELYRSAHRYLEEVGKSRQYHRESVKGAAAVMNNALKAVFKNLEIYPF